MTRAENWELILELCREANDDIVDSLRIELLNDFGKTDEFSRGPNLRYLASCFRSFANFKRQPIPPATALNKPLVFCLAATGSNLQNLLPVVQEARRRNLLGGIVTGEAVQRIKPDAFGGFFPVVTEQLLNSRVGAHFLPGSLQRATKRLKWMLEWLRSRNAQGALRVRQNFGSYLKLMVTAERARVVWREILEQWQPSCILSTSDFYPFEFQMLSQARRLGIPSAILQHGETNDVVIWPTYADTFLAWGESYREQLLKHGAPQQRVRVTGMPASDALFNRATAHDAKAQKDPVCLVLSHSQDRIEDPKLFDAFGRCLMDTIRATPDIHWKIKLHPAENDLFYSETGISKLAQVEVLPKSVSLEDSVSGSDVVCTIRSTAGLQAMMMQKPVIILDLVKMSGATWPLQGGGIYAQNMEEFKTQLNRLSREENFRNSVLEKQRGFLDMKFAHRGNAAAVIVDFLSEKTLERNTTLGCLNSIQESVAP